MQEKIDMLLGIILELKEEVKGLERELDKKTEWIQYYKNELEKNGISYKY